MERTLNETVQLTEGKILVVNHIGVAFPPDHPSSGVQGFAYWSSTSLASNPGPRVVPQQSGVVELRFFGGMTGEETAEVIGVSPATFMREWAMAKTWIYHELSDG